MPVSDAFRDYVLEQLAGLGAVTVRRMFGGAGIYHGGLFFAVLDDDQLFFKVDGETRPAYEAAGSGPFAPMPNEAAMRGYYEVPAEVLDDRERLVEWARGAVAVARSAAVAPRKRAPRAAKAMLRTKKASGPGASSAKKRRASKKVPGRGRRV